MIDSISATQLQILQHSLGVNQYGQGERYRNRFITGEGSIDHPDCMALVNAGLMAKGRPSCLTGGDDLFFVLEAGIQHVLTHSPKPPPKTRAQQRYQDYLNADSDMSFGDWMKSR